MTRSVNTRDAQLLRLLGQVRALHVVVNVSVDAGESYSPERNLNGNFELLALFPGDTTAWFPVEAVELLRTTAVPMAREVAETAQRTFAHGVGQENRALAMTLTGLIAVYPALLGFLHEGSRRDLHGIPFRVGSLIRTAYEDLLATVTSKEVSDAAA